MLKHKFQQIVNHKVPISDPNCPDHICFAKHVYQKIIFGTNGLTGGSDIASDDLFTNGADSEYDVDPEDNKMGAYAEEGIVVGGDNSITPIPLF